MAASDDGMTTFLQNLDVMVSTFGKRYRFATPMPAHLRSEPGGSPISIVESHASYTTARGPRAPDEDKRREKTLAAELSAHAARESCRASVPQVAEWLRKVRYARGEGTTVLSELVVLSDRLQSLCDIAKAVKDQSDHLSANASTLMVRKAKLEHVQEALQANIRKFTKVEDLVREAEHPMLSAASARFPLLLEEMEDTMHFLSEQVQLKSAKAYAAKLALAQQRALLCLRDAVSSSFFNAQAELCSSAAYSAAFRDKANIPLAPLSLSASVNTGVRAAAAPAIALVLTAEGDGSALSEGNECDTLRALLASLNDTFISRLDGAAASQRRLVEARCVAFEEDVHLVDIMASYREARGRVLFPLLRDWLASAEKNLIAEVGSDAALLLSRFAKVVCSFLRDALIEEKVLFEWMWLREDICASWETFAQELGDELYHAFRAQLLQTDTLESLAFGVAALKEATTDQEGQDVSQQYVTLVKRMLQDTQERMVFRVSVYLRSVIGGRRIGAGYAASVVKSLLTSCLEVLTNGSSPPQLVSVDGGLENCIHLLKTLYPAVERNVFSVFADEAIHMTLVHLSRLAKLMSAEPVSPLAGGPVDAKLLSDLYHLRHLLLLRETITQFDVSLASEEKSLDLSSLVQRKIEILQSSREAKKNIEEDMKASCESVIQRFSAQCTNGVLAAAPTRAEFAQHVDQALRQVELVMSCFIESASTRAVLLRPIQALVTQELESKTAVISTAAPALEESKLVSAGAAASSGLAESEVA